MDLCYGGAQIHIGLMSRECSKAAGQTCCSHLNAYWIYLHPHAYTHKNKWTKSHNYNSCSRAGSLYSQLGPPPPPPQEAPKCVIESCPGTSTLNFAEILMIFCTHISWVVPECSAEFGPKCEMAVILNRKITFLHFSDNLFGVLQPNLVRTLPLMRGTLSANLTSNDLVFLK